MTLGLSIVHFVIQVPKLVQMSVTVYRVQVYQVPIVNPTWPPKIQDGRHERFFFVISTSDRGDFPRIIEIALFLITLAHYGGFRCMSYFIKREVKMRVLMSI